MPNFCLKIKDKLSRLSLPQKHWDVHAGTQPSDSEVDQLVHEVEKYTLASHLFWGLWGIISVIYITCREKNAG